MRDLFGSESKPLRRHQIELIEGVRDAVRRGERRMVCQLPTGGGKTRAAAEIARGALEKGNTVAFTVPAITLIDQAVEAFEEEGIDRIGVQQGDHPRVDKTAPLQVCSVATLGKRGIFPARIVIVDECHIYSELILQWMAAHPETLFVGLSATPWRPGMKEQWGRLIAPVTMRDLIDRQLLVPFRAYAPTQPDLSKVKIRQGDYDTAGAAAVMSDRQLVADIVTTWLEKGQNRPTLCFCVDRAHAGKMQDQFEAAGVPCGYVDAFTNRIDRALLLRRFRSGEIKVICNVGVMTTGLDEDVRCTIMARPTKSEMLFVQMFGRGQRLAPGKDHHLFLDHTSNILRLGLPTDIHYEDLLPTAEPRQKKEAKAKEVLPKPCSQCGYVKAPKEHTCPQCGFKPVMQSKVNPLDGELAELGPGAKKRQPTQAEKQLFWGMAQHYAWNLTVPKPGMALALYKERFGEFPRGLRDEPIRPNREWLNWKTASSIRYRKRQEAERKRLSSQGAQP